MAAIPQTDVPTALTIAGSDSSGGAGIQADLRGFAAAGVHGASVITLVTAQGTRGIRKVAPLAPDLVRAQLEAVLDDLQPRACKTGALGNAAIVEIIADVMRAQSSIPLVVDPVVNPTRGRALLDDSGFAALVRELIPLATLIIPNKDEATRLAGRTRGIEDAKRACKAIFDMGAKHVLVKGGHFTGNDAVDLFFDGKEFMELRAPRLEVPPMHGLGCSLSALITGYLALGLAVRDAVRRAHDVLHLALRQPSRIGEGLSILANLTVAPSTQN
jgi:hydroxymethylpyrimidine/phosphomethylpyrimidine kinase